MQLTIMDTALSRPDLRDVYLSGKPFPVAILDDFLPLKMADGLLAEIECDQDYRKSNDYIFAKNKFESPRIESLGPIGQSLRDFLLSSPAAEALSRMYGRPIFVDPDFVGGGLHRGGEGSFLDMHVDFNLHPRHRRWVRDLNILLYLNKDWQPAYGGCLDLRNSITGETVAIEPRFNRMVLMLTKDFTFHGYKPIAFPPGRFRISIATYAYHEAQSDEDVASLRTTTLWVPDGGGLAKTWTAKFVHKLVPIKQRLFGSSTAKKK